jgi:pimeloyl-ACP methyl ester carboxylesterase
MHVDQRLIAPQTAADRLTPRVEDWQRSGEMIEHGPYRIFVRDQDGSGPPVLLLHGYPTSSYDWRHLVAALPTQRITSFDFLGFGLSDKPRQHLYSLLAQADLAEAIAARYGDWPILLVAHDMGTSVATELLARDLTGRLPFKLAGVLLFNGSMVIDRASLTISQKLLRSRFGPIAARLSNERSFRAQVSRIFSEEHPLSAEEAEDQWALLAYNDGHRILDRLTFYLHERVRYAERWHGALRDWRGRLELGWAGRDPVCTEAVLQAVLALRPDAPLTRLPELGHYPQLEDPAVVADLVGRFAAGPLAGNRPTSRVY